MNNVRFITSFSLSLARRFFICIGFSQILARIRLNGWMVGWSVGLSHKLSLIGDFKCSAGKNIASHLSETDFAILVGELVECRDG